jgi:hypothetical protein
MLYKNGNGSATASPRVINGRGVAHRKSDKRTRAIVAASVADGLAVFQPSLGQLARLFGVSVTYIRAAQRLSPGTRKLILEDRCAFSFTPLVKPSNGHALPEPKPALSDQDLATLAQAIGTDRWLNAGIGAGL